MAINNLKRFFTYKKINSIFLKFEHFFVKDTKNHGNRFNHSCGKRDSKT